MIPSPDDVRDENAQLKREFNSLPKWARKILNNGKKGKGTVVLTVDQGAVFKRLLATRPALARACYMHELPKK